LPLGFRGYKAIRNLCCFEIDRSRRAWGRDGDACLRPMSRLDLYKVLCVTTWTVLFSLLLWLAVLSYAV
jgi:hypothetical protein